jgi:hypothetical protein
MDNMFLGNSEDGYSHKYLNSHLVPVSKTWFLANHITWKVLIVQKPGFFGLVDNGTRYHYVSLFLESTSNT